MGTKSEQAVGCFEEGFCCSQAVLSVYAEEFGLARDKALQISCGISEPEAFQTARERGLFASVCPRLVRDAVEMLEEMISLDT